MWITEGGVHLSRNGYILTFLLSMLSTPTMLLMLNVWTGEGVQFSPYTCILKLLLPVLGLLLKMLLILNVWIGEESVRLSLFPHIEVVIGAICWSSKYGGIIGFIYLPFVVSNS